jgi:hypothetical protein
MKTARYWTRGEAEAAGRGGSFRAIARGWSDESIEAARSKAIEIARRIAERVSGGAASGPRYPYGDRPLPEPVLREFDGDPNRRAIVTRNAYGALVLNTGHMMFVDVDRKTASHPKGGLLSSLFGKPKTEPVSDPLIDAMRAVTDRHKLAARLYQTAAGYRLIVTSAPFQAGSMEAETLLAEFHSDPLYIRLCRMQESFRARLTPKPWRCQFHAPPVEFPFETADDRSRFEKWERAYNAKGASFATCRFISELGSGSRNPDFRDLIEYHDHESKALGLHKLA